MRTLLASLALLLVLAAVAPAAADELPAAHHTLVQVTQFLRYDQLPSDAHAGRLGVSARLMRGRRLGYAAGVDLDAGASEEGAVYNAELYPVGVGLRLGDAGMISAVAGVGVGGARGGVVPTALQVPVELRGRGQLGPVRAIAWTTMRATPLNDDRELELEGALALGWGRQDSYWRRTSAGSGPFVSVAARRRGDDDVEVSVSIGLELLGAD